MKPKIRFKGFEGEWKTSTIGDFTTSFSGGTPTAGASEFYGGNIPFIRSGEIHESKTELFLTEAGLNNSSAKVVEKGTLLYALYGATSGEVGISKIKGAINQAILAIYPNKTVDKRFLANYLQSHKEKIVGELLQGGQGNLSGALVKSISVTYPNNREQQTISDYVDSLDSQISASTSRLASLKQMKAASLQAMFPQEGETVPKIRFKGFEGEWKEQSLSGHNFFIIAGGDVDKILLQNNGKYPVIANALTNDGILGYYMDSYRVDGPAVTVTGRGDIGIAIARHYSFTPVVRLLSIKSNHNVDFLANAINCYKVAKESTGVPQLTTAKLQEYRIKMPMNIDEENAIGNYFTSLDRQISLQSQRLEKLKQIKSACLDKMFV